MAQGRRHVAADGAGARRSARRASRRREEEADDDHGLGDAGHQRGADVPGRFPAPVGAFGCDQLVDDDAAGDVADDDHPEAGRDQADAAEQHGDPAPAAGEVDRPAEAGEGEEREQQRQALDRHRDVLRRLQLVGLEDLDLGGVGRQLFGQAFADPDLLGEVGEQAAEVEA